MSYRTVFDLEAGSKVSARVDTVTRSFGEEVVVATLDGRSAPQLDAACAMVWAALDHPRSASEIARRLASDVGMAPFELTESVLDAVRQLGWSGLLDDVRAAWDMYEWIPDPNDALPPAPPPPTVAERRMLPELTSCLGRTIRIEGAEVATIPTGDTLLRVSSTDQAFLDRLGQRVTVGPDEIRPLDLGVVVEDRPTGRPVHRVYDANGAVTLIRALDLDELVRRVEHLVAVAAAETVEGVTVFKPPVLIDDRGAVIAPMGFLNHPPLLTRVAAKAGYDVAPVRRAVVDPATVEVVLADRRVPLRAVIVNRADVVRGHLTPAAVVSTLCAQLLEMPHTTEGVEQVLTQLTHIVETVEVIPCEGFERQHLVETIEALSELD